MSEDVQVLFRQEGTIGFIRLNRPKALNALSHGMILEMETALIDWADDKNVSAIVIEGSGEKAFCAGGDIVQLYHGSLADPETGRQYWCDEYRLNGLIGDYQKPYIALMDGIVMGGGVGVSSHGSHRIVTERTMLAMPETAIGFLPDVGGTYLLSRSPGKTGLYLGLTGARMNGADAVYAGFADALVRSDALADFSAALTGGMGIEDALKKTSSPPDIGTLAHLQDRIDDAFGKASVLEIIAQLEEMSNAGDEWTKNTLGILRKNCPLSVMATFEAINAASGKSLEECLTAEFRFAHRAVAGTEFFEGVRAAVIDRDKNPKWRPATLEDVTPDMVKETLAPLGNNEWNMR